MRAWFVSLVLLLPATALLADQYETRIPLRDGKLASADLSAALLQKIRIKGVELSAGSIDLNGFRGGLFLKALNASLEGSCQVELDGDSLIVRLDPKKLPRDFDSLRQSARIFTATAAPQATAAQLNSYGLRLPQQLSDATPLVVLVHGLDCNRSNWEPLADLLRGEGFAVAYFTYPSDGPLKESAALLTRDMRALRESFPQLRTHVIAYSMGGLIARRYIEGDQYAGGVERFIMIGTPNSGTKWAAYRWALELEEHYALRKRDPHWHWSWMITDGLGEAGRDLKPTSKFLTEMNSRPRRAGVGYTIIAGAQHPVAPIAAHALDRAANWIPDRAAAWPGFRHAGRALHCWADSARECTSSSDGPVKIASTRLAGVDDHVTLPADHAGLYYPINGTHPAAWPVIRDRLLNRH